MRHRCVIPLGVKKGMIKEHISEKTGKKVFAFEEKRSKGTYFVNPDCSFYDLCKEMDFVGFNSLPKGFSRDGYGFASPAGTYLASALKESFGTNIKLCITSNGHSKAHKYRSVMHVTLNHFDYLRILDPLRHIRRERNIKSNGHVTYMLGELFPKHCKNSDEIETIYSYEADKLSKIVGDEDEAYKKLSKADVETVARLYGHLVEDNKVSFATITVAEESKRKNERVYLESVVEEFEKRISNRNLTESDWQRFLQRYILLFNTSYVNVIEKLSVDLRGKYPDFMLVNVYGYMDIYEIKKPSTNLLKHDDSRDNYYWDTEVAKAITQTEKYVQMLIKKALDVREIIEEKYQIDVKVVRPRGFVVVGSSNQFKNSKMNDDFRLLANALKNVDIILYDELLNNLKNLLKRLKSRPTKSSSVRGKPRR